MTRQQLGAITGHALGQLAKGTAMGTGFGAGLIIAAKIYAAFNGGAP